MRYLLLIVFFLLRQCEPGQCEAADAIRVGTMQGQVLGTRVREVVSFKGIPYAAPPVGALRWRAPQPPAERSGALIADSYGPACLQPSIPGRAKQQSMSEDCLTLNIFKPFHTARNIPVMVWIHGGGFVTGAGGNAFYDGSKLAAEGVVVVTFNYRLGRLGWFAHPALSAEAKGGPIANYGMMDQIAALKWVKDNIAGFGGDSNNVTLFGESAGGTSVSFLMISPAARGLFQKAIIESGLGRETAHTLQEEEKSGLEFTRALGTADDVDSLRGIDAERVISSNKAAIAGSLVKYSHIVDHILVNENVFHAFESGHERPVPFIVGTNDDEASLFPSLRNEPDGLKHVIPAIDLEALRPLYTSSAKDLPAKIATDAVFAEPARSLARAHAAHAPTFRYLFSYIPEEKRAQVSGAGHGHEIQFVFGNLGVRGGEKFTTRDEETSHSMRRYWTNFAKSGDPNDGRLAQWKRCCFNDEILFISNDELSSHPDPSTKRLDQLEKGTAAGVPNAMRDD